MLRPIIKCMQSASLEVDRRKRIRGNADYLFESHRDICPQCTGKSFFEIKHHEHPCYEGFRLAIKSSMANRLVRGL